jgi:2,4-dienoyl-CoA reductase-like NADH-dependent reductase (Old Yellow Enzyme family)
LTAAQTAFEDAMTAKLQGGQQATALKNQTRLALVKLLRKEANYVQLTADNDLPTMLSSGFLVNSNSRTQSPLDTPNIVSIDNGGWETLAPSALAFGGELTKIPRAMSEADIAQVQNEFVAAAKRSLAAGVEFLELHFAHGYLAHEFLSPISNQRTDKYGGSFENRIRFAVETARAVRAVWPDKFPLAARISATELGRRRLGHRAKHRAVAAFENRVRGFD